MFLFFRKDNINLDYCLAIIKNQVENLEEEKKSVYETIDTEINMYLHILHNNNIEIINFLYKLM